MALELRGHVAHVFAREEELERQGGALPGCRGRRKDPQTPAATLALPMGSRTTKRVPSVTTSPARVRTRNGRWPPGTSQSTARAVESLPHVLESCAEPRGGLGVAAPIPAVQRQAGAVGLAQLGQARIERIQPVCPMLPRPRLDAAVGPVEPFERHIVQDGRCPTTAGGVASQVARDATEPGAWGLAGVEA